MTCKDCVHYEICDGWNHKFMELRVNGNNGTCINFKPKSRFVELPCEVGQTVYVLNNIFSADESGKVCSITIEADGSMYFIWRSNAWNTRTKKYNAEDMGKTVFLSREEAENALKEREKE